MDISKKTPNIGQISKGTPALANPCTDMKIVCLGEPSGMFAAPTEQTRGIVDRDAPDASELRGLYADPDATFKSGSERSVNYLNMLRSVFTEGQLTMPSVVTVAGDATYYIEHGRTRLVIWSIAWECLEGAREVKAISGLVAESRAKLGVNWRPDFRVISGGLNLKDTNHLTSSVMMENTGRKTIGDRGRYALAMESIAAWEHAHRSDPKAPPPPYANIATTANKSEGHVRSWHKLSRQTPFVVEAVMRFADGEPDGVSLNFVMQLVKSDTTAEEVERLVREAIESGATSVSDARATRRAISGGYDGDEEEENRSEEEPDGDEEPSEKKERTIAKFADKPLSAKVIAEYEDAINGKGSHDETIAIAAMKLATKGWKSLSAKEKKALDAIKSLSATIEMAKKAHAEKLAKKAAKAAAASAEKPAETPAAEIPAGE